MCVFLVVQSCPTLCLLMDCNLPGSSVHGILQARILEWVAIPFSRQSSWPRDWTLTSCRFFTVWAMKEALEREGSLKITYSFILCCSVTKSCLTLCNSMDCIMPVFPVVHYLLELAQTHVHWVSDAIQPSHPLSLNLSQHQGLFQWVGSSHQVAKVLELQLQHQSFQWIFRVDFL